MICVHPSRAVALLLALSGLAGCGGGGATTGAQTFSCDGEDQTAICIQNCNLGCNDNGCARTDIAQNEIIILQFSEPIDPNTVTPSSIRFRTATGEQPNGEFLVNGDTVEFVPTLAISGGQTFFGFGAGETYTMTIPGGETQPSVVRSTSGKPFARTMTCVLVSSLGIIDLNGVPPSATLVLPTPAQVNSAPRDTDIILEFNELIDATPFISGTQSPVTFNVRRNRPAAAGGFECDPASQPQVLNGSQFLDFDPARSVSVLTFRPTTILPGNICVEIDVTSGVQDLAGRPAQPQTFSFRTVVVPLVEDDLTEEFDADTFFDADASAGQWGGGLASFSRIGGDGRHGAFSLQTMCTDTNVIVEGRRIWRMNTANTPIPANNTYGGTSVAVTDGRYFFTTMVIPTDARLEFVGPGNGPSTVPPIITVAGRLDISGDINASGLGYTTLPPLNSPTAPGPGQPGAQGGPFGGRGGNGGDKILPVAAGPGGGGAQAINQGNDGENARLLGGHGYAALAANSRGRGSTVFPVSGLNVNLFWPLPPPPAVTSYVVSAVAGGSGGAFLLPGVQGAVITQTVGTPPQPPPSPQAGAIAPASAPLTLFPFPASTGLITRASEHFLVGGAGGGGAASQACMSLNVQITWAPGCGGGGGGGAFALRAGSSLRLAPSGRLFAKGGTAASNISGVAAQGTPAPAGGGAGGSIVLQCGGLVTATEISGALDVRGGNGGIFQRVAGSGVTAINVRIEGGNGANGFVRLETPTPPSPSLLANMQPAAVPDNLGVLSETDNLVAIRSKYRSTGLIFGPEYARYEIYATVDGVPIVLSDDPAVSPVQAGPGAAVRAKFQCAQLDLVTSEVSQVGPWRDGVATTATQTGIASEGLNGFRFALFADYTLGNVITVERIVVVYRV